MTRQGRHSHDSTPSDCEETKGTYSPVLSYSVPSSRYGSVANKKTPAGSQVQKDRLDWNNEDSLTARKGFGMPTTTPATQPSQYAQSLSASLVSDSEGHEKDEFATTSATRTSSIQNSQRRSTSSSVQFRDAWKEKQGQRKSSMLLPLQEDPLSSYNNPPRQRRSSQVLKTVQARARWAKLREYVTSGDFRLHYNQQPMYQQACFKNKRRSTLGRHRRSSLARGLQKEIQNDYEWSLRHCFLAIALYLVSAIGIFSFLLPLLEDQSTSWTMIDSMYFAVVTFTTIGYGDLTKSNTPLERFLACIFALAGVSSLGWPSVSWEHVPWNGKLPPWNGPNKMS